MLPLDPIHHPACDGAASPYTTLVGSSSLYALIHEAPFLDKGDHRLMEVGMVFTVEPGIYIEGLGGFRHSDTVAVTETGIDWLTDYPRDLASLVIPV